MTYVVHTSHPQYKKRKKERKEGRNKKREETENALSTIFPLVHVRIEIDIGDISIEYRTRRFDHPMRELGGYPDCVTVGTFISKPRTDNRDRRGGRKKEERGSEGTHAIPRIRFILPGATKLMVFACLMIGQRNWTSPPPNGTAPRFFI